MKASPAFQSLTRQYPLYGWGWIGWADMYALYPGDPWHNLERAAAILREAMVTPGAENLRDIAERLREILIQLGRPTEAGLVEARPATRN